MINYLIKRGSGQSNLDELVPDPKLYTPWALRYVRCHFSRATGSGSSTADMTISVYREPDQKYNTLLWTLTARGDAADAVLRIDDQERPAWSFEGGDQIQILWTNPDPSNLWWALEVGYQLYG